MQAETRERLMKLAEEIATEQDLAKYQALLLELRTLLDEKEDRLQVKSDAAKSPSAE
jgi:hypothetical protein